MVSYYVCRLEPEELRLDGGCGEETVKQVVMRMQSFVSRVCCKLLCVGERKRLNAKHRQSRSINCHQCQTPRKDRFVKKGTGDFATS